MSRKNTSPSLLEEGSIKGDVKKKHFSLPLRGGFFSDIQPLCGGKGAGTWIGVRIIMGCVVPCELRACKQRVGKWPTMVLSETRDQARHYSFVGLSEGAYGAP